MRCALDARRRRKNNHVKMPTVASTPATVQASPLVPKACEEGCEGGDGLHPPRFVHAPLALRSPPPSSPQLPEEPGTTHQAAGHLKKDDFKFQRLSEGRGKLKKKKSMYCMFLKRKEMYSNAPNVFIVYLRHLGQ